MFPFCARNSLIFAVCPYITVWPGVGGVGGSRSVMPMARSTVAARWVPTVTERFVVPLPM